MMANESLINSYKKQKAKGRTRTNTLHHFKVTLATMLLRFNLLPVAAALLFLPSGSAAVIAAVEEDWKTGGVRDIHFFNVL